jgi:RND family efflux transporter MFP subunit
MKQTLRIATFGVLAALLAGCAEEVSRGKSADIPKVEVALPVTETVSDFEAFTGRFEAIYTVEIRARVTGYLDKVHFTDGTEVKEGDLLFEIDPRPYETELNRTEATLLQAEAHQRRLDADQKRANNLWSRGAIGREEYDRIMGDYSEAQAAVGVAKAARDMARLSLEFTKVKAPVATGSSPAFSWRLSRRLVDPGNMVQADVTPLTTVVSLDPLYVYFEVDERTLLRLRRLAREGKIKTRQSGSVIPIQVGLADEVDEDTGDFLFPHKGEIDFSDNKVDPATGTLQLRGKIANPRSQAGTRVLSPGLFAHVRLPVGDPHPAILVPEQALARDQGQRVIYVVEKVTEVVKDEHNKNRSIEVDKAFKRLVEEKPYSKGWMVIEKGIKPGERVVVSGLQRIRDKTKVQAAFAKTPPLEVSAANPATASE